MASPSYCCRHFSFAFIVTYLTYNYADYKAKSIFTNGLKYSQALPYSTKKLLSDTIKREDSYGELPDRKSTSTDFRDGIKGLQLEDDVMERMRIVFVVGDNA
jgi:hypothetical protein